MTTKTVNIKTIGKLDFETGVVFCKGFPTQTQFEDIVKQLKQKTPFCNGSLSTAASYAKEFFKNSLGVDTTLHYKVMQQANSKRWNDSRF